MFRTFSVSLVVLASLASSSVSSLVSAAVDDAVPAPESDGVPVEEPPVEEPAEQAPAEEAPVEEPPVDEPVEQAPVEEPAEQAPAEEAPVEQAPVEEPAAEAPVEQAPVEEPVAEPVTVIGDAASSDDEATEPAATPASHTLPDGHRVANGPDGQPFDIPIAIEVSADEAPRSTEAGVAARDYSGVFADGVPVNAVLATIRHLESRDDYEAQAAGSSASGAYQVIDGTWDGYAGYEHAYLAPPEVQDEFAAAKVAAILEDLPVAAVPVMWYYPIAWNNSTLMNRVPAPEAGNRLTPAEYQRLWMDTFAEKVVEAAPPRLGDDIDELIPTIAFPVLGPVDFYNDWHAPRSNGRVHVGIDFIGVNGQPLRAAFDSTVTRIELDDRGIAGVSITLTRDDDVRANYFHLNDEDIVDGDGQASDAFRVHPDLEVGDTVRAGQIIGYMGTTGNAGIPHLHFEMRFADGTPIAPYPAVLAAQQREQCLVGIGPWSTAFDPVEEVAAGDAHVPWESLADEPTVTLVESVETAVVEIEDGRWSIGDDGSVTAVGAAAIIAPGQGGCDLSDAEIMYGSDAAGVSVEELAGWWFDDEVEAESSWFAGLTPV